MKRIKIFNISIIEYLRSSLIVDSLIKEFLTFEPQRYNINDFLKDNHPTTFDLHLEDSCEFLNKDLEKDFLKVYEYLSNRFYNVKNGEIHYNIEKSEEFQSISSSIDMVPLEANIILNSIEELCFENKIRFIEHIVLNEKKIDTKFMLRFDEVSDQHIHLGGAYSFSYRIHEIIKNPYKQSDSKIPAELYNKLTFREKSPKEYMVFLHFLERLIIFSIEDEKRASKESLESEKINKGYTEINKLFEEFQNKSLFFEYGLNDIYNLRIKNRFFIDFDMKSFSDYLLFKSKEYFDLDKISKADKYLSFYFMYNARTNKNILLLVQIYYTVRNILKSAMTQQHRRQGFGYFSSFSSKNSLRRNKEIIEKQHILNSLCVRSKKVNIEGRVIPSTSDRGCANEIASYLQAYNNLGFKKKDFNLRILFHFIKRKDNERIRDDFVSPRDNEVRKIVFKQSKALIKLLINPIYRKYPLKKEYFDEQSLKVDLIEHLGGIDAASAEYNTPPEVFASTFNYFKNCKATTGKIIDRMFPHISSEDLIKPNFKYTYHVGEDFRDIISGLRAIFEAVLFLNLKNSDRIGHALALGIDPSLYRKQEIKLPKGELLDNAVFIYFLLKKFGKFKKELSYYEDMINALTKEIYSKKYDIDDLIDAWYLRRNCPYILTKVKDSVRNMQGYENTYFSIKKILSSSPCVTFVSEKYFESALPDFFELRNDMECMFEKRYESIRYNKKAYEIFEMYHLDKSVRKKSKEFYQGDIVLFEDMYEYLQDIMMEELISKRNILVEVQLTSNVLIGNISSLKEHPIQRFRPVKNKIKPNRFDVRKSKLKVLINTDNPSIQNTNILLEYYQLFNVLKDKYGYERTERYLLDILEEGNFIYNNY